MGCSKSSVTGALNSGYFFNISPFLMVRTFYVLKFWISIIFNFLTTFPPLSCIKSTKTSFSSPVLLLLYLVFHSADCGTHLEHNRKIYGWLTL
nr:MAG TPA: hypothetical protein [Caudoviricetes sp.]